MQRVLIVVVLAAVLGAWYVYDQSKVAFEALTPESALRIRDTIVSEARAHGGEQALIIFRKSYEHSSPEIQHNAAHVLGEALYLAEGTKGVAVCTSEFNFGCYHGFFSKAIVEEGLDLVTELDAVCMNTERTTACQHGIGHGILEYVGSTKLEEALAICGRTSQPNPIAGCTSGVFMEYNGPLVVTEGRYIIEARPLENPNNPYAPCDTVGTQYRESCYHELPQWWNQIYESEFAHMGGLCAALSNASYQEACITGLGGIVAPTRQYSVEEIINTCALMPSQDFESECLQNAAWATAGNIGDKDGGARICRALPDKRQSFCLDSL